MIYRVSVIQGTGTRSNMGRDVEKIQLLREFFRKKKTLRKRVIFWGV